MKTRFTDYIFNHKTVGAIISYNNTKIEVSIAMRRYSTLCCLALQRV
jgi:hypothetical protein